LAVASGTYDNVSILLGDGTGSFTLKSNPSTDLNPVSIAIGDFNNDGILDLAVANNGSVASRGDSITIMIGNGDGTFSASSISSEGLSPTSVATGKFTGSGYLDLAVANACGTDTTCSSDGKVAILIGDGTGGFALESNTEAGAGPSALTLADLNADGKLDVAVANGTGSSVSILLGNGSGDLTLQTSPASPNTGSTPVSLAAGDFNGSGGMDLVTANENDANVSVLLQAPSVTLACGTEPGGTTCGLSPAPSYAPNLGFGSEPEGATVGPMNVTLTNTSNLPLNVTGYAITSGAANYAFDVATTCGTTPYGTVPFTLAAGADCTIAVDFTPQSTGTLSGIVQIHDNAANSPQLINLKGTGTAASATVAPPSLEFGSVAIPGPSGAMLVTLTNSGSAQLTNVSFSATSPFTAEPNGTDGTTCGTTLAANSNCSIAVTFSPSTATFQSGTLTVNDKIGTTSLTQNVNLYGTGVQATATASPGSLTFTGQVYGSTSVQQSVTLSNTSGVALGSISISIGTPGPNASEFSQTNGCGTSIPAYGNCTIYVSFTPIVTGATQTATLNISDSAGSQPVSLYGTGIKANTSTVITNNTPNPSVVGQSVTAYVTVTASPPGIGTPTGSVLVSDGTGDSCTIVSLLGGSGSCSLTPTVSWVKALTATYSGDSNFNASVSPAAAQNVQLDNTTTTINYANPNPLVVGETATVGVTVTPNSPGIGTPTGTVTVTDSSGHSCVATLTAGTGSCHFKPSSSGPDTLTATYSGDRNFKSSTKSISGDLSVWDFSISLKPVSEKIKPGQTDTLTLTLVPLGGFTGTVSLTCKDTDIWTTCTLGSNSVSVVGTEPIKVTVVGLKIPFAPGTYKLTFTGTFGSGSPVTGGLTHSITVLLTEHY
jgi:hypothetical protein